MGNRVIQILPTISYGDAVCNDVLLKYDVLKRMGCDTDIYAENIGPRMSEKAKSMKDLKPNKDDVVIFHMAIGSPLSQVIRELPAKRKVMVYHNITPAHFFSNYHKVLYDLCMEGRKQLAVLRGTFDMSLADSAYNKAELIELGYENVFELPITIRFDDYKTEPDTKILQKYKDDYVNILFVGRIAPNKKQEDIIKCFYLYKKYINPKSRLFLVGNYLGMERYYEELCRLISNLNLNDVYLTGHTKFEEILAYYRLASVFLCMSEHEGFCVPLVESMFFKVPIIAFNAAAVPETMGNSGVIVNVKKYELIAELIDQLVINKELRRKVIESQSRRLLDFQEDKIKERFESYIRKVL